MMQDLEDEGLPMPAVNQVNFSPLHNLGAACTPDGGGEQCGHLMDYCKSKDIVFNGYSPFGGAGKAGKLLMDPNITVIATASTSQRE